MTKKLAMIDYLNHAFNLILVLLAAVRIENFEDSGVESEKRMTDFKKCCYKEKGGQISLRIKSKD